MICTHPQRSGNTTISGWRFLGLLALLVLFAPAAQGQFEVTFRLVPQALWNEGAPDRSHILPSGTVFLYRAGSYTPEMVAQANEPQIVTPGSWLWISEAEDEQGGYYVSVASGKIHYPEGAEPGKKGLIGPVVPACKIDLGALRAWQGVTRLDAVSLDRDAMYPILVQERRSFLVPEGRFLTYTTDSEGVTAISQVQTCRAGEIIELSRPEAPTAEHQDLMVSVQIPEGMAGDSKQISAVLTPRDSSRPIAPQPPTAALRSNYRTTFFFLGAYAREPLVLQVRHPESLPYRQELSPLPGGVREFPDVELEPRDSSREGRLRLGSDLNSGDTTPR